ncbi:Cell wall-associated hydrolase, invasion-associated protein [Fictibacillus macauensis ZFHKF-1]|uniref:Cell wall-associated hydrolase, invasion-associated protein n=1 Tax=Fictibacillus macauensis ZFHKF-1 TaxID=1196324 RepID=I8AJ91_9BACL|nr:NlpC/P60 family protein [Fictibacillus macauensis]EIT85564.1 Cell wall-associated hydrolase, invasion-associated protein [Fictibacillus macauensis ZFHKF-1]
MKKSLVTAVLACSLFATTSGVGHAALGDQTLKKGMTHPDVQELQKALKAKGYFSEKNVTTYFGTVTASAVVKFQKEKKLSADGIVGPKTFQALGVKNSPKPSQTNPQELIKAAKKYIGVPYVWGGMSPKGFDCSGFIKYVFDEKTSVALPRTVAQMYEKGVKVSSPAVGDLVFFETYQPGASHAGIYIGNNEFIHSGSSTGVTVSSLKNTYWGPRYLGAKKM